jgi:hypothetical protein
MGAAMKIIAWFAACYSIILTPIAEAQTTRRYPVRVPTSRELYVGCFLYGEGVDVPNSPGDLAPFSATSCVMTAGTVYVGVEKQERPKRLFCPPVRSSETLPLREMALAYRRLYEAMPKGKEDGDGMAVMISAGITLWPCGQ